MQYCEYTPYGTLAVNSINSTNYLFTGKELDTTGLYFYGARYYDPEIGRFITADPTIQRPFDPQDLNRYSYCRNNPLNYVDPTGLGWFSKFWKTIVSVVATVVSIVVPPLAPAMWAVNTAISAYTAIQTGNIAGFVGGLAGGAVFGAIGKELALGAAARMGEFAYSFGGGAIAGAIEFGIGGFGSGFGAALASGESFRDSLKAGGVGAAAGAVMGAGIQGSYMAGWQNSLHGASRTETYERGIKRLHALSVKKLDNTSIVGSRPLGEPNEPGPFRHRYIRGRAGRFEMGPDETTGLIEINGENSLLGTEQYLNDFSSQVLERTVAVSQSGFDSAVNLYKAAWVGTPYRYWSHNSNYAVNTVIYGGGANVPQNLGNTPGFPSKI